MNLTIETTNAKFQPKEIKLGNYFFEFGTNQKNQPTFYYGKIKTVGKNKGQKEYFHRYYYNSIDDRNASALETINKYKERIQQQQKEKQEKTNLINAIDTSKYVGQIFVDTWGYDQTNIDFYQCTGATEKMLIIREIGKIMIGGTEGFMSCNVKPDIDNFIGSETRHKVKVSSYGMSLSKGHHYLSEYKYGEPGVTQTWYA